MMVTMHRETYQQAGQVNDIPTDEESGDEFELVSEGNHNVSHDNTGNNIIMSHSSVNENSKTLTLKNERMIKLEKKTMMLSILRLETKLLRLSKKLKPLV